MPSRTRIRVAFLALPLVAVLQLVATSLLEEPYPALSLPAFGGGVPDERGQARVVAPHTTVTFADGSTAQVDHQVLLADVHTLRIIDMKRLFLLGRDADGEVVSRPRTSWVKLLVRGAPGGREYDPSSRVVTDDPELRTWLRSRLGQLFPGRVAVSLTVRWTYDTYLLPSGTRTNDPTPFRVVTVRLA